MDFYFDSILQKWLTLRGYGWRERPNTNAAFCVQGSVFIDANMGTENVSVIFTS